MKGSYQAKCTGYGRLKASKPLPTNVGTGAPGWITAQGPIGPQPMSAAIGDILDIAAVVYRSERLIPRRSASNPNVRYELVVPVSDPDLWRGKPGGTLEELLGFLGMAEWTVQFVQRPRRARRYAVAAPVERSVARVALLSGGLDSTSGVGAGLVSASDTQLCSFYTRQRTLQAQIAASLGFPAPTQWRLQGGAGRGRSFYYRSFLFLALAAATADTFGAREIVQFETGILAGAIPPVPSLAMTRHAHPRLHRLFAQLLRSVLGDQWRILNPLWQMTKRQAVEAMRRNMSAQKAEAVVAATQSCWNLSAPHVFGVRRFDRQIKRANQQCGVCVPCIVRRTALPQERFAFDLRRPAVRNHPKLSAHFLEYAEFLSAIRAAPELSELRRILPAEALDLIDDGWTDLAALDVLLRRFAQEFFATFGLRA
jgi:7-cyano-7-deazaguanine synthase in queuosine biosynthesis